MCVGWFSGVVSKWWTGRAASVVGIVHVIAVLSARVDANVVHAATDCCSGGVLLSWLTLAVLAARELCRNMFQVYFLD